MASIFIPKGRKTFYIRYTINNKTETKNIYIPKNKRVEAEKFKKEFEVKLLKFKNNFALKLNDNIIDLSEAIENYLSMGKINWSEGRYKNVTTTLKHLVKVVGEKSKVVNIKSEHISNYISYRKPIVCITTLRSDIQVLRAFFSYLLQEDLILKTPIRSKHIPKPEVLSITTFTDSEIVAVLDEAKAIDQVLYRYFYILGATGARPSDILNLHFEDINLNDNILKIKISKTNREIIFPVYNSFKAFIIDEFGNLSDHNPEELIFGDLMIYTVGRKFRKIKNKLALNPKYNLKTFRKSFASKLCDKDLDGSVVAYLLGHTSVNTTAKYYINRKTDNIKNNLDEMDFDITRSE